MELKKAKRHKAYLKLGVSAVSGGGKSMGALLLAKGLVGDWEKIAVIDTENGSANLYDHLGNYNVLELKSFSPNDYIKAIDVCIKAGMKCIVIDGITFEWDWCLAYQTKLGGKYQDWGQVTPLHDAFKNKILQAPAHIITTVRRKQEYEIVKEGDKTKVNKVGLAEQTRGGWEYELTLNLEINEDFNSSKLTIENRIAHMQAIPDDVLEELKSCHVILKGPTTTPQAGSGMPNIESANVAMRKALDLFANVRPVKVPEKGIDWTFFRENTEGAYAVGSKGINVDDDLAFDFVVATSEGSERIAKMAYEYARKNHKDRVSIINKANVIKTTDGKFLNICKNIGKEYPEITTDEWYIDITTAKLIDEKRRKDFKVFVLPNLYGDIITDEAAEFQGGVGTAGSANLGKRYAMFEAIHGSAPRMISEGRGQYADPCSMLRATVMLLSHIGKQDKADLLEKALDYCMFTDKKYVITGREDGATCSEFGDYVMETVQKLSK